MDQQFIIDRIKDELARCGQSRGWLADAAGVSPSTLDKNLSGSRDISRQNVLKYERALEVVLRPEPKVVSVAPDRLGAYSRNQVEWLIGNYVGVRRAQKTTDAYVSSHLEIEWDATEGCLAFRISALEGSPYESVGVVSLSSLGTQVQLISEEMGAFELINLKRPDGSRVLRGIHLLTDDKGGIYAPVARKVALAPLELFPDWSRADYGLVRAGEARHYEIADILEPRIQDDIFE